MTERAAAGPVGDDADPAGDVDHSLVDWYRGLTVIERLRAASRAAATLDKLRHAASANR